MMLVLSRAFEDEEWCKGADTRAPISLFRMVDVWKQVQHRGQEGGRFKVFVGGREFYWSLPKADDRVISAQEIFI